MDLPTTPWLSDTVVSVGATLIAYWWVDCAFRRQVWSKAFAALGVSRMGSNWALLAATLAGTLFVPWEVTAQWLPLQVFACVQAVMLAWKSASEDIDVAAGEAHWPERGLLVVSAVGAWFSPLWILLQLQLITEPFHGWKHHGTLPLRAMQLAASFVLAAHVTGPLGYAPETSSGFLMLLFMMIGSHYVITAVAKGMLGPKWHSWMLDNRLHHVVASAYVWGWARFLPRAFWARFVKVVKKIERPLQIITFIAEGAAPLVLLDPMLALGLLFTLSAFHVGVFLTTGILFWEWIVCNALAISLILVSDPLVIDAAFGIWPFIGGLVLMIAFPLRGRLWAPTPLGWWDTPLTQRVQWRVRGESGQVYGLHNDFMCPHERLYGRVHGCFMVDEPVCTYHLGEVWRGDLRDEIRSLRDAPERLEQIHRDFSISIEESEQTQTHVAYLKRFLRALNDGKRKFVFPKSLRWLKAPGGQFYYWGDLPRYRGQEPAREVEVWYREEYWDGEVHHEFLNKKLVAFEVDSGHENREELDEKVVDAMVLIRAQGKLVDVPEWMVAQAKQLYG
ncbi:MAG: hypothetical protein AAF658_01670 [Myxococcota bacterium]